METPFRSIEMMHAAQARAGHTPESPFDTNSPIEMKAMAYAAFIEDLAAAVALFEKVSPKRAERLIQSWQFLQSAFIPREIATAPEFKSTFDAFFRDLSDMRNHGTTEK